MGKIFLVHKERVLKFIIVIIFSLLSFLLTLSAPLSIWAQDYGSGGGGAGGGWDEGGPYPPEPTPTPIIIGCTNCTGWMDGSCGGTCSPYQRFQYQYCFWNPPDSIACQTNWHCVADPACGPAPTSTPISTPIPTSPPVYTHRVCSGTSCVTVVGSGANQCSSDADCRHKECSGSNCVTVAGAGADTCSTNSDCQTSSHRECRGTDCRSVSGSGKNLCSSDADCLITHTECSGGNCITVSGAGIGQCGSNADCTATHNVCNVSQQCVSVAGAGANQCTSNGDCGGPQPPTPIPTPTPIGGRAWFQTTGGDVHTQGDLRVSIPSTATNPNFSLELNNYPGVISHQSFGGAYFGEGYPSHSEAGHWLAESKYEGKPYFSFEFFKKKFAMEMTEENFDGSLPQVDGVYYAKSSKTLSGNWTVPASRWLVILVEGEVTIPNDIKVNEGGFLAIASSGNIIFGSSVTQAQGMFIADGKIDTGSGSTAFEGQGVFAASDFSLSRDFANTLNETTPVETFIARPDFIMNSYKDADNNLWWFYQKWQELAP